MCHGQVLKLHWSTVRCLAYVCMVLCEHGCYKKTEPERTPLLRAHSVSVRGCAQLQQQVSDEASAQGASHVRVSRDLDEGLGNTHRVVTRGEGQMH